MKLDFFEAIDIPIPPVETQQEILREWHKARKAIAVAEEQTREIVAETEREFFTELGLKVPTEELAPKVFSAL